MMNQFVVCVKRTQDMLWCAARTLLSLALAIALGGCGGDRGPERVVVSGSVTYNGNPVPEAQIEFVPVQTSSLPVSGALVTNGQYKADNKGGVPVGTHKVTITAYRKVANTATSGEAASLHSGGLNQYIPEKYNAKTQLEVTIPSGSGKFTKDFALTD